MKKTSKKKISIIIAIIIAVLIVGGVSAYLTDTDNKTNVFTVGSVKISLNEENWDELNGGDVLPGQIIQKDPTIENTGDNSAYVYIKVVEPLVKQSSGSTGPLFSYTTNSGWTQLSTCTAGKKKVTLYYYNTALTSGNSTTSLFNNVAIGDFDQDSFIISRKDMIITGYAIQSSYLQNGTTIQSAYSTYFEENIAECQIFNGTIYRFTDYYLYLEDDISELTKGSDYVTNKSEVTNMNSLASKYYLKHDITANKVTKSYLCFNVTEEMKASYPSMTVGEYCIAGTEDRDLYDYNRDILLGAFGADNCEERTTNLYCTSSSFNVAVHGYGVAYASFGGEHTCYVSGTYSYCN
jgi:predicted ribosomally synthesized peptide with SipW-like signal peptide